MPNRLALEKSPYLLQHKDNPVDWHPWGPEAFAQAKAQDKPVFLSIGYSTCHWCHVMEHESFEKDAVARVLNDGFVSIKVDREERPDVDDIYMTAVQMMTGSGGWPLSLFLTPEGHPFYGGTYFPPDGRYGRPGFVTLLNAIRDAWRNRRVELEATAGELLGHLSAGEVGLPGKGLVGAAALDDAQRSAEAHFDPVHGGFGGAPKFPPAMRLELLIRRWLAAREITAKGMAETTLANMAAGGMYDQVGGGFHRYSTDAGWLVPHFEKMLYDNAMLARVYVLAHRAFGGQEHARIACETLDYLLAEMTPEGGGFFCAQDADSGGEEGTFYVWNPSTLAAAVGPEAAPIVAARFGVTPEGNFENGETVLSAVDTVPELARRFRRPESEIAGILAAARAQMYAVRSKRVRPGTDDKLLTDWSSLAISAFALAGRVLSEPRYETAARDAADRILERCRDGARLLHREKDGRSGIPGFASDYAFFIEALLDLYEATFEPRYVRAALELESAFEDGFADPRGGFFFAGQGHDGLILRPKETADGATPSSNSVAAMNLLRLHALTGEVRYRERAEAIFGAFSGTVARAPAALPRLLCALDFAIAAAPEIVLAGELGSADFEALRAAAFASPRLNRILAHADAGESLADVTPLVSGRGTKDGRAAAYVCADFACQRPTTDPKELAAALDA
jgi:uncharacterized protein YyaL (SSP411 family)